jgi:hypothetical protein
MALTWEDLLAKIPPEDVSAAKAVLSQYSTTLLQMTQESAWGYIMRLMEGDLTAVSDVLAQMSDEAFILRVKQNTARWQNVARYEEFVKTVENKVLVAVAPVLLSILLALVGL